MEDGAPCHTTQATQDWCRKNEINKIRRLSQPPDMNPIEHFWGILNRNLRKKNRKPSSKDELLGLLRQTWQEISQDDICQIITGMPRRALALKKAKGISTKYLVFNLYKLLV